MNDMDQCVCHTKGVREVLEECAENMANRKMYTTTYLILFGCKLRLTNFMLM